MKRKLILLTLLSLTIITGCSQKNNSNNIEDNNTNNQTNEKEQNKQWGVTDSYAAFANNESCTFYINFPTYAGIPKGTGLVAYDDVGSLIIVDSQTLTSKENIPSVDDVLPTLFEQTKLTLDLYRNSAYRNFEFEITLKEHKTINGYEMCKYTGIHTFTFHGDTVTTETMNFIAYSTQLKTNGAYVYWMVLDETSNQSLSKTIDSHAYNMALSLREE